MALLVLVVLDVVSSRNPLYLFGVHAICIVTLPLTCSKSKSSFFKTASFYPKKESSFFKFIIKEYDFVDFCYFLYYISTKSYIFYLFLSNLQKERRGIP